MKNLVILIGIVFLIISQTTAQFSVAGAEVSVDKDAILAITGDAINDGKIQNAGIFAVAGNWENKPTFVFGGGIYDFAGGTFLLNGNLDQQISHNGQDFGILTVEGTGLKNFTSNATLSQQLNLTNGIIKINNSTTFTLERNANTTSGTNASHVSGILYREGIGTLFFPIGKDGIYAPAELYVTTNNSTAIGLEVTNDNIGATYDQTIGKLSEIRYWSLYANPLPEATIALSYDRNYSLSELDSLSVAQADTAQGNYSILPLGQNSPSFAGVVSGENITKRYFALAIKQGNLESKLYIPNTLSPYANSPEDQTVKIYGDIFIDEDFAFSVYNKWGNLVFSTNELTTMTTKGWDGKSKKTGKLLPFGVYSYIYKAKLKGGTTVEKSGTIMILR